MRTELDRRNRSAPPFSIQSGSQRKSAPASYDDLYYSTELKANDILISTVVDTPFLDSALLLQDKGDLLSHTGTARGRLPAGTNDQVLMVDTSASVGLKWASLTTTKGDILSHNASDPIRLPVGTAGQSVTPDTAEPTGLKWVWGSDLFGLGEFGTGLDGSLTVGAGTTTLGSLVQGRHYTYITLASGATLRNAGGSMPWLIVLYCSEYLEGTDSTSIITRQDTTAGIASVAGGAAGGGGGAGGSLPNGQVLPNIFVYAKHIIGSGLMNGDGGAGNPGGNATVATATSNGANGIASAATQHALWNENISGALGTPGNGTGGLSAGGGGTGGGGAATGWTDAAQSSIRDMQSWKSFSSGWNYTSSSTASWHRHMIQSGGTSGAAGGRNTGAQGGGGGASGEGPPAWPSHPTAAGTRQDGSNGGAGAAGGPGAGGGGGASGATGSIIFVMCLTIAAGWTLRANGGAGGNGGAGFDRGGGGAGGVGGDGGWVILFTAYGPACTISVAGGTGGTGGAPGSLGGSAGVNGATGRTGVTWNIIGRAA